MKLLRRIGLLAGLIVAGAALTYTGTSVAQNRLQIGGRASNFGRHTLRGGFVPDPFTASFRSGGNLDASSLGLGAGCRGHVTGQPDYILDYQSAARFLRFYFVGNGDTTLVINDARGNWHCNDDSHGGLNPTVDIDNPPSGQYDIWVGSYSSGQYVQGTLNITELRSNHP